MNNVTHRRARHASPFSFTSRFLTHCARYLLAEGPGALYVAFIGTKHPRDLVADVNVAQAPLYEASAAVEGRPLPRVHRGFLTRARAIPIVHLYQEARRRKRRLVLCGHSLGGCVAAVSALRLLLALREHPSPEAARAARGLTCADDALPLVRVISFAQPPVGDANLRALVQSSGWEGCFRTMDVAEDIIPRLLQPRSRGAAAASPEEPAAWHRNALDRVVAAVPRPPTLPDFHGWGRRMLLLPDAVVPRGPRSAAASDSALDNIDSALLVGAQGANLREVAAAFQTRFLAHKMRSYRARVTTIAAAAAPDSAPDAAAMRGPHPSLPCARIAPRVGPLRVAVGLVPLTLCPLQSASAPSALRVEVRGEGLGMASRVRVRRNGAAVAAAVEAHRAPGVPPVAGRTRRRLRCRVALPQGDLLAPMLLSAGSDFEESEQVPLLLALRTVHLVDAGAALPPGTLASLAHALAAWDAASTAPAPGKATAAEMQRVSPLGARAAAFGAQVRGAAAAMGQAVPWPRGAREAGAAVEAAVAEAGVQLASAGSCGEACGRGVCFRWDEAEAVVPQEGPPGPASSPPPAGGAPRRAVGHAVSLALRPIFTARAALMAVAAPLRRLAASRSAQPPAPHAPRPHALLLLSSAHAPLRAQAALARSHGVPVVMAYLQGERPVNPLGAVSRLDPADVAAALAAAAPRPAAALLLSQRASDWETQSYQAATVAQQQQQPQLVFAEPRVIGGGAEAARRAWARVGEIAGHAVDTLSQGRDGRARARDRGRGRAPPMLELQQAPGGWGPSGLEPAGVIALRSVLHRVLSARDNATLSALADAGERPLAAALAQAARAAAAAVAARVSRAPQDEEMPARSRL